MCALSIVSFYQVKKKTHTFFHGIYIYIYIYRDLYIYIYIYIYIAIATTHKNHNINTARHQFFRILSLMDLEKDCNKDAIKTCANSLEYTCERVIGFPSSFHSNCVCCGSMKETTKFIWLLIFSFAYLIVGLI